MDQYGYLLNQLIAGSSLITDIVSARQTEKSGRTAILLPSATVIRDDSLPHSWQVTSDTIAAWVAHRARCRRLVLLKNVDGLMIAEDGQYSTAGLIAKLTVEQLAEHSGGVDEYLCRFLASANLEVWVINGLRPKRLAELLDANCTIGTRIIPAAGKNPPAALA
jgi:aspartokinase-like uncharacterized kinase